MTKRKTEDDCSATFSTSRGSIFAFHLAALTITKTHLYLNVNIISRIYLPKKKKSSSFRMLHSTMWPGRSSWCSRWTRLLIDICLFWWHHQGAGMTASNRMRVVAPSPAWWRAGIRPSPPPPPTRSSVSRGTEGGWSVVAAPNAFYSRGKWRPHIVVL